MSLFLAPKWLWLLLAVLALSLLYVALQLRRKHYAARFTNTELLGSIVPRRPGWRRHVAFGLLVLALASLTTAMAKPTHKVKVPRDRATVVMAVDVSLSMKATDVAPSRIAAAKQAAKEFVKLLPPRINLGLVSFAGTADVLVTPTTNRDAVDSAIDNLQLAESTAIGEAVFSCLSAIQNFQTQLQGKTDQKAPPARVVLMSDGTNTIGRSPNQAVAAAKRANVPVSTIAFGTDEGTVDINGEQVSVPADKDTLHQIAKDTGGSFHSAATAGQLREVFRDLGSQIGFTREPREVTTWLVGTGLLFAFAATGLSLFWTNRLL
ncbi:MAG TPA: VWA domain-containing protein [Mycobacteriales bacterium]|nr:VWA domain-containing protein [Mycobacteriales bacterium]